MLLFNFVNYVFFSLCYVFLLLCYALLLLCLCILIVTYIPFWVFCFIVLFCVLLCVNVECTTAIGCLPNYS
jgi:hypothetical protein